MGQISLREGIRTLSPAYFGLPMSTGIIAIASFTLGYRVVADLLFVLNNIELNILSTLIIFRLFLFFPAIKRDISSHEGGADFLAIVAAFCILGAANVVIKGNFWIAVLLWHLALVIWLVVIYFFFILITIKKEKPGLRNGINGSWLLIVVSAQALSILGNLSAQHIGFSLPVVLFLTSLFYLFGALFYIILIGIIFYRIAFFRMLPHDFEPSNWINMGAAAISTLAGTILIKSLDETAGFHDFIPILKVLTVMFWVIGTWWIPALVILEIRKQMTISVKYSAGYWSLVFPLGVYTFCTWHLALVLGFPFLENIPEVFIYVAWIVWLTTFVRMCIKLTKLFL